MRELPSLAVHSYARHYYCITPHARVTITAALTGEEGDARVGRGGRVELDVAGAEALVKLEARLRI